MSEDGLDISTPTTLEEFCQNIKISNALELFRSHRLDVTDILNLEESDVNELIPATLLKERLLLREFLKGSKKKEGSDPVPEFHGCAIDLSSLLKCESRATHLLKGSNAALDSFDSNLVAKTIVNFWNAKGVKPTRSDFNHAYDKVKYLFKKETVVDWIGGRKIGRGLLHNRWYNENKLQKKHQAVKESVAKTKRKSRKGMPMPKRKSKSQNQDESLSLEDVSESTPQNEDHCHELDLDDTEIVETSHGDDTDANATEEEEVNIDRHIEILKNNLGPIAMTSKSWDLTFAKRQEMKYSVENFKALQSCDGHVLIANDFEKKFKKGNALHLKFSNFKKKILPFYKKNIRDSKCKGFINQLGASDISEDSENLLYLQILHGYLVPQIVRETNPKVTILTKYSILDGQKFFISIVKDMSSLITTINILKNTKVEANKKAKVKAEKTSLQPMVFAVGKSELELQKLFYVYIDDITYQFDNLLDAVSLCFKLIHVIDRDYMDESFQVWRFIERYFYEIESSWTNTRIDNLIKTL